MVKLIALRHPAVSGNRISLRVSCAGTAACNAIRMIATTARAHHRPLMVGRVTRHLAAGHRATLVLLLNRAGRTLLARHGKLAITLVVTVHSGTRTLTVVTSHPTLHRPGH